VATSFPLPPGEGQGEGIENPVKHLARTLRRQHTRAEQWLWSRLRNRPLEDCKFRRQQVIGPYIVDFLSVQPKLTIEVDGAQHAERTLQDTQRTEYLQRLGYQVVRYWNDQVLRDVEAVMESTRAALIAIPSPPPSPGGRGS